VTHLPESAGPGRVFLERRTVNFWKGYRVYKVAVDAMDVVGSMFIIVAMTIVGTAGLMKIPERWTPMFADFL